MGISSMADVRNALKIGKLSFCSIESSVKGRFGRIFKGKFEESVIVAIERIKNRDFIVQLDVIRKAQNHPNVLRYYCNEQDVDFV